MHASYNSLVEELPRWVIDATFFLLLILPRFDGVVMGACCRYAMVFRVLSFLRFWPPTMMHNVQSTNRGTE